VFYGTSTQDRSICAILPGAVPALAVEDGQNHYSFLAEKHKLTQLVLIYLKTPISQST